MTKVLGPSKRLAERTADRLMGLIFSEHWRAGDRLPPERELAEEHGVDRTSLRSALAQLQRMNLIDVLQGSGATVRNFAEHAGIEFLAAVFAQDDLPVPPSYLAEAFDAWVAVMPWVVEGACARATLADFRKLSAIFDQQLESIDDVERLLDLEMQAQKMIVSFLGNTVFLLLFNSTAPIRRRVVRFVIASIDSAAHVEAHRALVDALVSGRVSRTEVAALYRKHLLSFASNVREKLYAQPTATPTTRSKRARGRARP